MKLISKLKGLEVEKSASKKVIKSVSVIGNNISKYVKASLIKKEAEEDMLKYGPSIVDDGCLLIAQTNCASESEKDRITSINLVDQQGSAIQVSWTGKALKINEETFEEEFSRVKTVDGEAADISTFLEYRAKVAFDEKVFETDGNFDAKKFNAFKSKLDTLCAEVGIENPIRVTQVAAPKTDFSTIRWTAFDVDTNVRLQKTVPFSVSLKPIL